MIVTVQADNTPPRVRIETTAATVHRVAGGARVEVRGGVTDGVAYDYECPQETVVTYDDGLDVSAPVEMPSVGPWLVPLADAAAGCRLIVTEFSGWSRPGNASVVEVPGAAHPIVRSFGRGGRRGSMTVATLTADDFDALSAALDVTGPAFLSVPSSHWPMFGLVSSYVSVGDVEERHLGSDEETWLITLPLTPVDRPAYVRSTRTTWADLAGMTWGSLAGRTWATIGGG